MDVARVAGRIGEHTLPARLDSVKTTHSLR